VLRAEDRSEALASLERHDPKIPKIPFVVHRCAEMGMSIDKSREDRVVAQVDGFSAGRNLDVGTYSRNLSSVH